LLPLSLSLGTVKPLIDPPRRGGVQLNFNEKRQTPARERGSRRERVLRAK
jgi:hypothetical protein